MRLGKSWQVKTGYMYSIDVALAIIILLIGLLLAAGLYFYSPEKTRTENLADHITGVLAATMLADVCPDMESSGCSKCSYDSIKALCLENPTHLKNPNLSLLEFLGQLYHDKRREDIRDVLQEVVVDSGVLPANFEMEVLLLDPAASADPEQLYPLVVA